MTVQPYGPDSSMSRRSNLFSRSLKQQPSAFSVVLTFCWRAILKIKHIPEQLLDVTVVPIIFLLLFTYLFGGALAGSPGEYLDFVLPGIVVMMVIFVTIYTGVGINDDIRKGVFDRFRSLPIWRPGIIAGGLLADSFRYALALAVVILLGLILGYRPESTGGLLLGLLLLVVFASCLSWLWIVLGLVMRSQESFYAVSMIVLYPLTFVSNVFVLPETMPRGLEALANANPVTHLVTALRGLISGEFPLTEIGWVLLTSAVFLFVFAPLAMYFLRRKR